MALCHVDFFSSSLMRTTTINAIIPCDKTLPDGSRPEPKPFKTLYLLHGIFGNYMDWVANTRIKRWAQDHNLAVIMPSGENKFYVDQNGSLDYGSRFIEELVYVTRDMFHLSHKKEDTFIGGLSMGGYGAIINGLKYKDLFGRILGFSSALRLEDFIDSEDDPSNPLTNRSYLKSVFGDLEQLAGSDRDYHALAKARAAESDLPEIYLSCGTEDDLLAPNEAFAKELRSLGYDVVWKTYAGAHEWDFWGWTIKDAMDWLPLDEPDQAVSSGNVDVKK